VPEGPFRSGAATDQCKVKTPPGLPPHTADRSRSAPRMKITATPSRGKTADRRDPLGGGPVAAKVNNPATTTIAGDDQRYATPTVSTSRLGGHHADHNRRPTSIVPRGMEVRSRRHKSDWDA